MTPKIALGIEHHLGDAGPVSQIDKNHHAMVAPPLHPAIQDDGFSDLFCIQLAAAMCADLHTLLTFFPTYFLAFTGLAQPVRLTSRLGPGIASSPRSTEATRCSTSSRKAFAS